MYKKRIFAELVFDTDPNLTNVLISADWHLWMIDFTRAFRILKDLRNRENIIQSMCERQLFERLKTLDRNELTQKTKRHLTKAEIDGVMARRDKIVAIYTDLIAKKGENAVLYSDKRP
jgi:ribosomal protein S21